MRYEMDSDSAMSILEILPFIMVYKASRDS